MAVVHITFEGTTRSGKKKSKLTDEVLLHVADPGKAEEIFLEWLNTSSGIRGTTGVFHPLGSHGTIKVIKSSTLPNINDKITNVPRIKSSIRLNG